jgi:hypothetical protein
MQIYLAKPDKKCMRQQQADHVGRWAKMLDRCVSNLDIISYFRTAGARGVKNGRVREVE